MNEKPPAKWLTGWKALGLSVLGMVLISVALFSWYYYSTADLVRVRAEAKALGIPTTWAETGIVVSSPEVIQIYNRIGALSASLMDYDSLVVTGKIKAGKSERLKPYLPIPQAAFDHHAKLNAEQMEDLLTSLDRLPHHPLVLRSDRTNNTNLLEIGWQRSLTRLLGERVLLAPRNRLVEENRRLLHLSELYDPRALIDLLVYLSVLEAALNSSAGRFAELKTDDPGLADLLDRLADQLDQSLIQTFIGEFIIGYHSVTHIEELKRGMGAGDLWSKTAIGPVVRAGREPLLRAQMEWIAMLKKHPTLSQLVVFAKNQERDNQLLSAWIPSDMLLKMLANVMPIILHGAARCRARLYLMAAELRGQPWPVDPYDPSGKPLRPFLRDGKLMGAYSVSEDGVDNGGDKRKDRYFPLYGPLEAPVVVAEPTAP